MGNLSTFICGGNNQTQKYLQIFQTAVKLAGGRNGQADLLNNYGKGLQNIINVGKPTKERLGSYEAELILMSPPQDCAQRIFNPTEKEVKIILRDEATFSEPGTLTEVGEIRQGYIIFSEACYYGQIQGEKAHGKGTLYYPGFEITGQWHRDSFKVGTIFRLEPTLGGLAKIYCCQLQLNNGERDAIVISRQFEYRGSITLKGSKKLSEVLTGQGFIMFRESGDSYRGQLKNGLFDTSMNKEALYTYATGDCKSYQGLFKNGLRNDRGIFEIKVQDKIFRINARFSNGVPVEVGLINSEDNESYSMEVIDNRFVIRSKIADIS